LLTLSLLACFLTLSHITDMSACPSCRNVGCGGMCSKCHRDLQAAHEKAQATAAAVTRQKSVEPAAAPRPEPVIVSPPAAPEPSTSAQAAPAPEDSPAPKKQPTRCQHPDCKKKLGLTGFTCKCEMMFCPAHRLAESHSCSFDYKTMQRQKLAENNPLVQASKLTKI
jgi:hypothetical protein